MSFQGISITGDNKLMKKVFRRNGEVNLFFNTARTCNESAAVRASAFPKTAAQLPSATGDEGLLTWHATSFHSQSIFLCILPKFSMLL